IPADHAILSVELLDELIAAWRSGTSSILVPRVGSRRGHPAFFRWKLAREVPAIPEDCGLNWLLQQHAGEIQEVAVGNPAATTDLDTPEDYERLRARFEEA